MYFEKQIVFQNLFKSNMNKPPFNYCLSYPNSNEEITSPFVLISGWIIADKGNIISNPTVCNSGRAVHSLTSVSRPDVEAVYPNSDAIGFHECLSIIDLGFGENWSIEFLINGNQHSFPLEFKISLKLFEAFSKSKSSKLQKIRGILRCPLCGSEQISDLRNSFQCCSCQERFTANESRYNFLPQQLMAYGNVKPTGNVSSHNYDPIATNIIEQFKNGLILDNGCGLRNVYYDNVVNFEIVDYPTTDVLGIGERLPFKSNVFDAVFSLAVLEHVKNPFECAQEIIRVLKPGGTLYAVVPFLQPFHGYPDHYYNMTSSGLKNIFSGKMQIVECSVPLSGLPIWCLSWFLNSYIHGLPEPVADKFKKMKVSALLDAPREYLDKDFVTHLSPAANEELACTNSIIAKKLENHLQQSQLQGEELPSQLQPNQTELEQLQYQLQYTQAQLQQAHALMAAMQTSKFWKLRERWFKLKTLMGQK
jgi:SAM-dependent methyltransferase